MGANFSRIRFIIAEVFTQYQLNTIGMQPADRVSFTDLLLSKYCSSLYSFYSDAKIVLDFKTLLPKEGVTKAC